MSKYKGKTVLFDCVTEPRQNTCLSNEDDLPVDKVDGKEMLELMSKVEGRGSVALRQPIPDRPELEQRFTKALVCFHVLSFAFITVLIYDMV